MATYFIQNTNNVEDIEQMNNVIDKVNKVNTEATSNIGQLTDLNAKAEELSNNIQQALPINSELIKNTESAKVANTNLLATNQEATTKNTELQASLEKTKEFINGLDGSQNIPQIRMDVTELQNGLKSNQALEYKGSSISAENTLEGRTESLKIEGRTLVNLAAKKDFFISEDNSKATYSWSNMKNLYKAGIYTIKNITGKILVWNIHKIDNDNWVKAITVNSSSTITLEENQYIRNIQALSSNGFIIDDSIEKILSENVIILDNNQVDVIDSIKYFEGLKSFGETEKVGDKYKISILSSNAIKIIGKYVNYANDGLQGDNYQSYVIKCDGVKNIAINLKDEEINRFGVECWKSDNFKNQQDFVGNLNYFPNKFTKQIFSPLEGTKYIKIYLSNNMPIASKNLSIEVFVDSFPNGDYREDKKDILIKEPLRSKDDKCDILYEDNGQVKIDRYVGIRKYQEGDEKNKDVITDKINTVYILDKPVTEIVENCVDIDLDTFGEKTYFNILNSLPGILDFKVPSNIASIVQNTAKEVNNIWDVINNLLVPSLIDINKNVAMATIKNNLK